jgi:hypothetical protein
MCICNRNWQGNDCSEKVCQFGTAHVDTPKGDLDMSGDISGPNTPVVDNSFAYPYGTTEQFPQMEDSDLNKLPNSAHYYMECSNKGVCDRTTGECTCYPGYDGVACQRASCPGYPASCSGHGVCKSKNQLAFTDNKNVYKLWDKDATMGCECDAGYFGADCSLRQCKAGVDPLYLDDSAIPIYSVFNFATVKTSTLVEPTNYCRFQFSDGTWQSRGNDCKLPEIENRGPITYENQWNFYKLGYFAIRFFDIYGEDWLTEPITAMATCPIVVRALENLPNNVVPAGSVKCSHVFSTPENPLTSQSEWGMGDQTNGVIEDDVDSYYPHDVNDPSLHDHFFYISYRMKFWDWVVDLSNSDNYNSYEFWLFDGSDSGDDNRGAGNLYGAIYNLKFYGNPGALKQPEIEIYLNGKNPTLQTANPGDMVITKVWTDGKQGETKDYLADHCDDVTFKLKYVDQGRGSTTVIDPDSLTDKELGLLKACLGDSDFDVSNNRDVYNWDYGNKEYPHLVKIVKSVATSTDGGNYVALWYDPLTDITDNTAGGKDDDDYQLGLHQGSFVFMNPYVAPDVNLGTYYFEPKYFGDEFEIYTTKGTFALTSNSSFAVVPFASNTIYTVNPWADFQDHDFEYTGDLSCEIGMNNAYKMEYITHCVNKSDIITYLSWNCQGCNPPNINLYTAERLSTQQPSVSYLRAADNGKSAYGTYDDDHNESPDGKGRQESWYMINTITTDLSTNWATGTRPAIGHWGPTEKDLPKINDDNMWEVTDAAFYIYKFFPSEESTYEVVAPCSNRGICAHDTGLCQCFPGYTSDDCSVQNSIAL